MTRLSHLLSIKCQLAANAHLCLAAAHHGRTLPPHIVPVKDQQMSTIAPEFMPFAFDSVAAGHTPNSATRAPPGWRPHFSNSQQFWLMPFYRLARDIL